MLSKAKALFCLLLLLQGCASHDYVDAKSQSQFTYEMWLPAHSKAELWKGARDYFATAYRSDEMAFDPLNPDSGSINGIGAAPWHLPSGEQCRVAYQLQFTAMDDRAKLRFIANLDQISGGEGCDGWQRISPAGYAEMTTAFTATATALQTQIGGPSRAAPEYTLPGSGHGPVTINPGAATATTKP
ncbi:MAG TPA: hypothetical protein VFA75_05570 [Nevskia sp.]|jgi:hypothetical protein|nr:hypothetical protein [Nevskia sp.]